MPQFKALKSQERWVVKYRSAIVIGEFGAIQFYLYMAYLCDWIEWQEGTSFAPFEEQRQQGLDQEINWILIKAYSISHIHL